MAACMRYVIAGAQSLFSRAGILTKQCSASPLYKSHSISKVTCHRPLQQICRNMATGGQRSYVASSMAGMGTSSGLFNRISSACTVWPLQPVRTKTNFNRARAKPSTVRPVTDRFKRLETGLWIRTRVGKHRGLWKKSLQRRLRLQEHIFCNNTQCRLLDKMVTKYWKEPKYYPDDPYKPYQKRTGKPNWYYKPPPFLP